VRLELPPRLWLYERVAAFVRQWKGERQRAQNTTDRGTFVPLVFAPGEAFQFDWSEDWAYVGGERLCCTNPVRDSSRESSVVAGWHEQTHTPRLQDQELARL
jgi:hypothetical protein